MLLCLLNVPLYTQGDGPCREKKEVDVSGANKAEKGKEQTHIARRIVESVAWCFELIANSSGGHGSARHKNVLMNSVYAFLYARAVKSPSCTALSIACCASRESCFFSSQMPRKLAVR